MGLPGPRKPTQPFTTNSPNPRSRPTGPGTSRKLRGDPMPSRRTLAAVSPHASSGRARAISPDARCATNPPPADRCPPCPPLARCWLALGILPSLASNAGSSGTGPPLANPYSVRGGVIKAPRREPGGRRAVGPSRSPEAQSTVHHHPAQSACTTNQSSGLHASSGRPRAISPDARFRHPAFRSLVANLAFAILASLGFPTPLDRHGLTPREPVFRGCSSWKRVQAPRFARSQSPFP